VDNIRVTVLPSQPLKVISQQTNRLRVVQNGVYNQNQIDILTAAIIMLQNRLAALESGGVVGSDSATFSAILLTLLEDI
jgi:hypothetical protein